MAQVIIIKPVGFRLSKRTVHFYNSLRLPILRLSENWDKYSLDQSVADVPPTNNGTERLRGVCFIFFAEEFLSANQASNWAEMTEILLKMVFSCFFERY